MTLSMARKLNSITANIGAEGKEKGKNNTKKLCFAYHKSYKTMLQRGLEFVVIRITSAGNNSRSGKI